MWLNGQAVATARLLENHSIGRVAVVKEYRDLGVGNQLMQAVIALAKAQNRPFVKLSSQVHVIAFLRKIEIFGRR